MIPRKLGKLLDTDITEPINPSENELIMIISASQIYKETLSSYLLDLEYAVAGPFDNVDRGSMFYRRNPPDLIIFDAHAPQSELISFSNFLKSDGQDIPVLVIKKEDELGITHTNVAYIKPPINLYELDNKLKHLLKKDSTSTGSTSTHVLEFTNNLFLTILDLVPDTLKTDIRQILQSALTQFSLRNSDFGRRSEESISLKLTNPQQLNLDNYVTNLQVVLEEIILNINETQEAEWGRSLVQDALETILLKTPDLPDPALQIVEAFGKDPKILNKRLKTVVPDHATLNKSALVAKLTLSDLGPVLNDIVSRDPSLVDEFDASIASQLVTLIGQGSSYHEGIYGPVPLPKTKDIVGIMWSKLMSSDIADIRMGGRTLVVICVGFRHEIINLLPPREILHDIFAPLEDVTHSNEITEDFLKILEERFEGHLKDI